MSSGGDGDRDGGEKKGRAAAKRTGNAPGAGAPAVASVPLTEEFAPVKGRRGRLGRLIAGRATLLLLAFTAVNALLGLVFTVIINTRLGVTATTDAYAASFRVPSLIGGLLLPAIAGVLIPILASIEDKRELRACAWRFIFYIAAFGGVFIGLLIVLAPLWGPLLVPRFAPPLQTLTVRLAQIQLVSLYLNLLFLVIAAAHQAQHRFALIEGTLTIGSVGGAVALYYLLPVYGIVAASCVLVAEWLLQVALALIALGPPPRNLTETERDAHRARLREATGKAWTRLRPLLLGGAVYKTDGLLETALASSLPQGSLTLYNQAQQMYSSVLVAISKAGANPVTPTLARQAETGDWRGFDRVFTRRTVVVTLLALGVLLALAVAGKPFLVVLFQYKKFTAGNVTGLWVLLLALGGFFLASSGAMLTTTAFYAQGDTKFSTRVGVITYIIYVPLKIWAALRFGIIGLAIATSLLALLNFAIQGIVMKRTLRRRIARLTL